MKDEMRQYVLDSIQGVVYNHQHYVNFVSWMSSPVYVSSSGKTYRNGDNSVLLKP